MAKNSQFDSTGRAQDSFYRPSIVDLSTGGVVYIFMHKFSTLGG